MVFHSSAKVVENDGTREMGSRVQCNEFGDETNQRLVESGTSAKLVGTSVRLVGDDFCLVATTEADSNLVRAISVEKFVKVLTDW